MPLKKRAIKHWKDFKFPLSYVPGDTRDRFLEAHNIYIYNGRTYTRPGCIQQTISEKVNSICYYKDPNSDYDFPSLIYIRESDTSFQIKRLNQTVSPSSVMTKSLNTAGEKFSHVRAFGRLILLTKTDLYQYEEKNNFLNTDSFSWFGLLSQNIDNVSIEVTASNPTSVGGAVFTNGTEYRVGCTIFDPIHGYETKVRPGASYTYVTGQTIKIECSILGGGYGPFQNPYLTDVRFYIKNVTTNSHWTRVSQEVIGYFALNTQNPLPDGRGDSGTIYAAWQSEPYIVLPPDSTLYPPDEPITELNGVTLTGSEIIEQSHESWPTGGNHLSVFDNRLVVFYDNEVWFSKKDSVGAPIPEVPHIKLLPGEINSTQGGIEGDGIITGGATGFYNNSMMEPYLVIFKRNSCTIYSEINGSPKLVLISKNVGCVSAETIEIVNGDIFFLSEFGFVTISNGKIIVDDQGNPVILGDQDIGSIFSDTGFYNELNKTMMESFHSIYDQRLKQYLTFVSEGSDSDIKKVLPFHLETKGFARWEILPSAICSTYGPDESGRSTIFLGCSDGIYSMSYENDRKDSVPSTSEFIKIPAHVIFTWLSGGDYDATYNFYEFCLETINAIQDLAVSAAINFTQNYESIETIENEMEGFELDVDMLGIAGLADERLVKRYRVDLHRTGINIAIKVAINSDLGNLQLISSQIHFNKNGNRN
jgi:hypothetical protein